MKDYLKKVRLTYRVGRKIGYFTRGTGMIHESGDVKDCAVEVVSAFVLVLWFLTLPVLWPLCTLWRLLVAPLWQARNVNIDKTEAFLKKLEETRN